MERNFREFVSVAHVSILERLLDFSTSKSGRIDPRDRAAGRGAAWCEVSNFKSPKSYVRSSRRVYLLGFPHS